MIVCKLSISYDRGCSRNREEDLAESADGVKVSVLGRGAMTKEGKVIRGLGSHFRSEFDAQLVAERDKEARRIYKAFRERFLSTPIDGLYAVPGKGIAKMFLNSLEPQHDIQARVSEFEITTNGDLDAAEIKEWSDKIKRQLQSVSLGRTKEIDENGLDALLQLSSCPLIQRDTARQIKSLVEAVRVQKIDRVELRRSLDSLSVGIETTQLSPRRAPKILEAA